MILLSSCQVTNHAMWRTATVTNTMTAECPILSASSSLALKVGHVVHSSHNHVIKMGVCKINVKIEY